MKTILPGQYICMLTTLNLGIKMQYDPNPTTSDKIMNGFDVYLSMQHDVTTQCAKWSYVTGNILTYCNTN